MKSKLFSAALFAGTLFVMSFVCQSDKPMVKESDGTYVVNTTTLCKDVKGYKSNTPLKIYIKKDKIVKVEALPNQETPKFFQKVEKAVVPAWNGKSVKAAQKLTVDGVTQATMSSNAVKENMKRGLEYYVKNR